LLSGGNGWRRRRRTREGEGEDEEDEEEEEEEKEPVRGLQPRAIQALHSCDNASSLCVFVPSPQPQSSLFRSC